MPTSPQKLLETLGLAELNAGTNTRLSEDTTLFSHGILSSFNPATEECLANVRTLLQVGCELVILRAFDAFEHWKKVPAPKRGECVRLIGDALRAQKQDLASLICLESGKIMSEAQGEVQEMIDMADFAVGQSRMLYGKTMHSERSAHRMYEQWHPLGPIAVITAFNFPMAVWSWNAFIAAICGNTVIWKPSSKTPLCAIAVQKICERVMHAMGYPDVFSLIIPQDNALTLDIAANPNIPLVSFTGSVAVGRKINEFVAQRLGKTLLELSGNNAIIVDETADLKLALQAILFGAIGTAGQRCTTTRRLFIHKSRYSEVIQALQKAYKKIHIGDPTQADILMGPLIDSAAVSRYSKAIETIKEAGGKILHGGHVLSKKGYFVEPTLVEAENHWDIVQTETFAPILYLMSYQDFEHAITAQNAVPQGLSSALFTQNLLHAEQFLSAMGSDCGIANVNLGTSGAEIGGAFGGEKETGGGREAGSDAWRAYMRRQTNVINWGSSLPLAQNVQFNKS